MLRCAVIAILWFLASAFVSGAKAEDCNQSYGEWKMAVQELADGKELVYFYCLYTFEPEPDRTVQNYVIWYPTKSDTAYFYYNNPQGKYWCRALNRYHDRYKSKDPLWNVITSADHKKEKLGEIPTNAWGPDSHPICPGSDTNGRPGCRMLAPPNPPVQMYLAYSKANPRKK